MKYADDLVLLVKEEVVLHGMTERLIEIRKYYGMVMNVEKTKVMKIKMQPSPLQIMVDKIQLENAEYFNYK